MYTTKYFIEKLNMIPHVEGGYYKESLRDDSACF
ncbi:MAG: cupin domain-containing protein [Cellulosilyticaceae bacterium]